jgi:hypothetical protein
MFNATNSNHASSQRRTPLRGLWLWGVLFSLGLSGCSLLPGHHKVKDLVEERGAPATLLPRLIGVTTGPVAVLVTNGGTFSAAVKLTFDEQTGTPLNLSGILLVRGDKFRLEYSQIADKPLPGGVVDLIWDATARQGWVLSEGLQGYAPIADVVGCTNLLTQVLPGSSGRVDGHPVDQANVTLQCGDGQTIALQLSRALDLGHLPLQIRFVNQSDTFLLALSNFQTTKLEDGLFLPPDDFRKFDTAVALVKELADRQQNVANGGRQPAGSGTQSPGMPGPKFGAMPRTP